MLRLDVAGRKPRGRLKMKPDRADPCWAKQCWLKCTIMHSLKEDLKFPDVTQELKKKKTSVSWRVSAHLNAETKTTLTRDFFFFFAHGTVLIRFRWLGTPTALTFFTVFRGLCIYWPQHKWSSYKMNPRTRELWMLQNWKKWLRVILIFSLLGSCLYRKKNNNPKLIKNVQTVAGQLKHCKMIYL